jgi:hypothetical protein
MVEARTQPLDDQWRSELAAPIVVLSGADCARLAPWSRSVRFARPRFNHDPTGLAESGSRPSPMGAKPDCDETLQRRRADGGPYGPQPEPESDTPRRVAPAARPSQSPCLSYQPGRDWRGNRSRFRALNPSTQSTFSHQFDTPRSIMSELGPLGRANRPTPGPLGHFPRQPRLCSPSSALPLRRPGSCRKVDEYCEIGELALATATSSAPP